MQLPHFLLVLLLTAATTINVTVATEGQTNSLPAGNHRFRTKDDGSVSDNNSSHVGKTEMEERGMFSSALSKVKGMFGKNTDLGNKFNVIRKNPDVVAALDNSPVLKSMATAVVKDPNFLTKLASKPESVKKLVNSPEMARVSSKLEKANVKITKGDIKQLGAVVSTDPAKASKLKEAFKVLRGFLRLPVVIVVSLVFVLVAIMVGVGDRITK